MGRIVGMVARRDVFVQLPFGDYTPRRRLKKLGEVALRTVEVAVRRFYASQCPEDP